MPEPLALSYDSTEPRLLIVDDEPNIRSSLVRALSLLGYFVEEASSGYEALSLLTRVGFDLMVLDMSMPGLDGVEVMHRARQLHPELLIIVLTGHASLESAIAAVKLNAVDYVRKPATIRDIADTVTRALQKHTERVHRQHLMGVMAGALDSLRRVETRTGTLSASEAASDQFAYVPPVTLNRRKLSVWLDDNPTQTFELTEGEADVLASLMAHPNRVLTCRQLAKATWNDDLGESDAESVIRPYIFRLRHKLEANPKKPKLIRTVRKRGYLFASSKN